MGNMFDIVCRAAENCERNYRNESGKDYTDSKTGLLHCGLCHTPKQVSIDFLGKKQVVYCICKCQNERYERERAKIRHMEQTDKNRENSSIPAIYKDATCLSLSDPKKKKYAYNYVQKFDIIGNKGFLLYGDVGMGKSYFAACIASDLLKHGKSVKWLTAMEIAQTGSFFSSSNYDAFHDSITSPDLLIIDDLGAERGTDFALERVHEIVDYRISSCKPLIITTNYELSEMRETTDLRKKRTFDRIFRCCFPLAFHGVSYRQKQAKANYDDTRNLLCITE